MQFMDTPSSSFPPQLEGSARCAKCSSCASGWKAERKEQNVQARQALGITAGLNQMPSSKLTVHSPLATAAHSAPGDSELGGGTVGGEASDERTHRPDSMLRWSHFQSN